MTDSVTADLVAWIRERCWSMSEPPRAGANIVVERDRLIECGDALERLAMEFRLSTQQAEQLRDERDRLRRQVASMKRRVEECRSDD